MIHQVFAVYDSKAKAYAQPFFQHSVPIAQRAFGAAVNDPALLLCKYPEDYTLFHIGTYDDEIAQLHCFPEHTNLGLAVTYKQLAGVDEHAS